MKKSFIELHRCEIGDEYNSEKHISCLWCYENDYEVYLHCLDKGIIKCVEVK